MWCVCSTSQVDNHLEQAPVFVKDLGEFCEMLRFVLQERLTILFVFHGTESLYMTHDFVLHDTDDS